MRCSAGEGGGDVHFCSDVIEFGSHPLTAFGVGGKREIEQCDVKGGTCLWAGGLDWILTDTRYLLPSQ